MVWLKDNKVLSTIWLLASVMISSIFLIKSPISVSNEIKLALFSWLARVLAGSLVLIIAFISTIIYLKKLHNKEGNIKAIKKFNKLKTESQAIMFYFLAHDGISSTVKDIEIFIKNSSRIKNLSFYELEYGMNKLSEQGFVTYSLSLQPKGLEYFLTDRGLAFLKENNMLEIAREAR